MIGQRELTAERCSFDVQVLGKTGRQRFIQYRVRYVIQHYTIPRGVESLLNDVGKRKSNRARSRQSDDECISSPEGIADFI